MLFLCKQKPAIQSKWHFFLVLWLGSPPLFVSLTPFVLQNGPHQNNAHPARLPSALVVVAAAAREHLESAARSRSSGLQRGLVAKPLAVASLEPLNKRRQDNDCTTNRTGYTYQVELLCSRAPTTGSAGHETTRVRRLVAAPHLPYGGPWLGHSRGPFGCFRRHSPSWQSQSGWTTNKSSQATPISAGEFAPPHRHRRRCPPAHST